MENVVQFAINQSVRGIPEGVPIAELSTIVESGTRALSEIERMAYEVQKNKIFNPTTLRRSWKEGVPSSEELIRKLTHGKLMKSLLNL